LQALCFDFALCALPTVEKRAIRAILADHASGRPRASSRTRPTLELESSSKGRELRDEQVLDFHGPTSNRGATTAIDLRLYQLVRQPRDVDEPTCEITVIEPGVEVTVRTLG
jgi:hypothetical protein